MSLLKYHLLKDVLMVKNNKKNTITDGGEWKDSLLW